MNRGQDIILIIGRLLHGHAALAEGHYADAHRWRFVFDESLGGGFGSLHACWGQIIGGHAARYIKRQNHRAFDARHTDDGLWPGQRNDEDDQRDQEDQRRQVTANPQQAPCPHRM